MNCSPLRALLVLLFLLATIVKSPAPLIYTPGEGWTYEAVGASGSWQRTRAKDQLEVAKAALDKQDYSIALKAARRTVKIWPLSDFAPEAQYIVGRAYEGKGDDERAFNEYQRVVEKYPRIGLFQEVLQRQSAIADRFLNGQRFRLWGLVPLYRSMEKTADMYEKIVRTGPYSEVAPHAQLSIGTAHEKRKEYPLAVKAYERAADRYSDQPAIAAEATFRAGTAHWKQAQRAEYDQSAAGDAIDSYTDFMTLFPGDPRVKQAQKTIDELRSEQARGNYEIARYYEEQKKIQGALVYYNEVLLLDPTSKLAEESRRRIEKLRPQNTPANK